MEENVFIISMWSAFAVVFCFALLLYWINDRSNQRRASAERDRWAATAGDGLVAFEVGVRYRLMFRTREPIGGLRYVGNTGHGWSEPLQNRLVFENAANQRVVIKASMIQIFETMPD